MGNILRLRVVDHAGNGVAGASAYVRSGTWWQQKDSNRSGEVVVFGIPQIRLDEVEIRCDGWVVSRVPNAACGQQVVVAIERPRFTSVVRAEVVDAAQEPVAFECGVIQSQDGRAIDTPIRGWKGTGSLHLTGLPSGTFCVSLRAPGYKNWSSKRFTVTDSEVDLGRIALESR